MAEYTYEQLKGLTVAKLREIAQGTEHEALEGHSTMHKEQLLPALCKALDIHVDHAAHGAKKTKIKTVLKKLKSGREAAKAAGDHEKLAAIRCEIHTPKHQLRRMAKQNA